MSGENICFTSEVRNDVNGKFVVVGTVNSTYLTDSSGNFVRDPSTGKPYIVPVGYNPEDTINRFVNSNGAEVYISLYQYKPGGEYDLQRNFNGNSLGGFVKDYTPIASFDVGLAAASGGVSLAGVEFGGGTVNEVGVLTTWAKNFLTATKDIWKGEYTSPTGIPNNDGIFYNNLRNPPNIEAGFAYYKNATQQTDYLSDFIDIFQEQLIDDVNWFNNQEIAKSIEDLIASNPDLSDQLHDLATRLSNGVDGLDTILSTLTKTLTNKDIEDTKSGVSNAKTTSSPIILDLNGNGIETTGVKQGAYFDHANDGFAERTGWVDTADGLLVLDLNGNGKIDNGGELFGSETLLANGSKAANGFEALKALDSNGDHQINTDDAAFASLKIWIDADGDGHSQASELLSLPAAGVTSIVTTYSNSTIVDAQGNAHRQLGTYTRADGSQAAAEDVWFAVDRTYSIATTWADVPTDIAGLPNLSGYGTVRDLQQAMTLDTSGAISRH